MIDCCYNILMDLKPSCLRRLLTDAAGYLLLLGALLTGWLPGPGGIPLALAGLGLLSIHNEWARRVRIYLLKRGGALSRILFPEHKFLQFAYDVVVTLLLAIVALLALEHGEVWQVSLGTILFFLALFIGLMNRNRYGTLKAKLKRK